MIQSNRKLTVEEFFTLSVSDVAYELIEGQAVTKMSPKRFHAGIQKALLILMDAWAKNRGHLYPEWAVKLKRNNEDWIPVTDITYVSCDRLSIDWIEDEACPVAPELVIEIISPGQTFGGLTQKATDYLAAGVLRVWIVDSQERSVTVFYPDAPPRTYTKSSTITDSILEGLELTPQQIFQQARLPS
jgi:Uma2 family endonuclease